MAKGGVWDGEEKVTDTYLLFYKSKKAARSSLCTLMPDKPISFLIIRCLF
jgi:hypothetical protein